MGYASTRTSISEMHKGRRRPRVFLRTRSIYRNNSHRDKMIVQSSCSPQEQVDSLSVDSINNFHFVSDTLLNTHHLSNKYRPKLFTDIVGHEIAVQAISKAVEKKKVGRLYLFFGPSGSGKTSTARIFAKALNCESESASLSKPCWSCRGCSRSLSIMELFSKSRTAAYRRLKTLLESQAIPGFKVLIIKLEECHSFGAKAWGQLLGIVERGYTFKVVFVFIAIDMDMVPLNISSRCQKFCFSKLNNEEIRQKLTKIVACEDIRIENEALKLIAAKARGSLREAENLMDQLALTESTITSSMVLALVGLLPQNKLLDLLTTAMAGDTISTIRHTRELLATGVEPQALLSQLASLITDILSHAAAAQHSSPSASSSKGTAQLGTGSELTNFYPERLCHALRILVQTEKQLKPNSTDQTSRILAALLDITSGDVCTRISIGKHFPRKEKLASDNTEMEDTDSQSRNKTNCCTINRASEKEETEIIEPSTPIKGIHQTQRSKGKKFEKLAHVTNMEEVWQKILRRVEGKDMQDFLCHQVKLASLTLSSAHTIVHLIFKRHEDKMKAQMCRENILKALQSAIGCPATINMSLEPVELGIVNGNTISNIITHSKSSHCKLQKRTHLADVFQSRNIKAAMHHITPQQSSSPPDSLRPRIEFKDQRTSQGQCRYPSEEKEENMVWTQQTSPFLDPLTQKNQFQTSRDPERDAETSIPTGSIIRGKPKHRWLSLSSIPQSDASVEPYSQDILFEKAHDERESNNNSKKGILRTTEIPDSQDNAISCQQLKYSWSCTDILCSKKTRRKSH